MRHFLHNSGSGDNTAVRTAAFVLLLTLTAQAEDWPDFRGPTGSGHSSETRLPLTWSEKQNIRWKVAIPGKGWSSPVVVGNEVWLTTATDNNQSLRVVSVDAARAPSSRT